MMEMEMLPEEGSSRRDTNPTGRHSLVSGHNLLAASYNNVYMDDRPAVSAANARLEKPVEALALVSLIKPLRI
ncbi:hypothetical protein NC653_038826 [Populus alba x Populus x berolinensis]|uniref:Uncharacterized protein n=1 Tax=Populus alba x Populus x berolinensis TaxID=444605 RepID=A0AAD6PTR6_9ROSI|nr:hypothetical protein NC653_038125 [Populus alba x Populus x berolinensis]KAJ6960942.1 hypothetical protein NC653_038826 [Populus alba x Populus x berolinensis]